MIKKIKLAVIGFSYNHPTGQKNIRTLEELARRYPVNIDVVTVSKWKGYNISRKLKKLERKNFRIHFLEPVYLSHVSLDFRYFMRGLLKKLKKINPDIIYVVDDPISINSFYSVICAKALKKKIFGFTWETLLRKRFFVVKLYEKFILKNMSLIIAGSKKSKEVLVKKGYPESRIDVFPHIGVDINFFRKMKKNMCKKLKIKKNKTILFAGRLEKEKGIDTIFKAKEILEKAGKKYYYFFVGRGTLLDWIKSISEKDKMTKVLQWVEYKKLPEVYNSAEIFVYPSEKTELWEEQFGYSILEAMACGLPVIASKAPGPCEIINNGKDGFLVNKRILP